MDYPQQPGFKVTGPSAEAALAERPRAATLREKVEALIGAGVGYTADECAALLGESVLAVRPRLSELVAMGKIEDSGARRPNASGHKATVWREKTDGPYEQQDFPI